MRTVRVGETGRAVSVSDQELAAIAPVQLIRHALPHELADQLLDSLLQESDSWKASSWIVHGNQFTTPRTSAIYEFAAGGPSSSEDGFGKEESRTRCEPSATLDRAADLVQNLVRERRPFANWAPTLALGNRYENGRACVGWHSDFLNSLGPRPIIVGLSLGSCRRFCLRRSTAPDSPRDASKTIVACRDSFKLGAACRQESHESCRHAVKLAAQTADSKVASIPMPHNTADSSFAALCSAVRWSTRFMSSFREVCQLCFAGFADYETCLCSFKHELNCYFHREVVIMWDDCQEEWQHSVPRQADSTVEKHAVAGSRECGGN